MKLYSDTVGGLKRKKFIRSIFLNAGLSLAFVDLLFLSCLYSWTTVITVVSGITAAVFGVKSLAYCLEYIDKYGEKAA